MSGREGLDAISKTCVPIDMNQRMNNVEFLILCPKKYLLTWTLISCSINYKQEWIFDVLSFLKNN